MEELIVVQLGSVDKSSGPGKDGGYWVSRGTLSLLPESIMSSHSTMSSFSFNYSIFIEEDRGHESKRSISLGNDIRLDISIIVLAGPDESS
jgi:hypothetical protein